MTGNRGDEGVACPVVRWSLLIRRSYGEIIGT